MAITNGKALFYIGFCSSNNDIHTLFDYTKEKRINLQAYHYIIVWIGTC